MKSYDEYFALREEMSEAERAAYLGGLRADHLIPPRYHDAVVWDPTAQRWIVNPRNALYIYGPIGSGKSYLAWALVRRYLESTGRAIVYAANTAELLHRLRPGGERWTKPQGQPWEGRSQPQRINDLEDAKTADLLLLDDLGAEHLTDFAGERLLMIIDHRYNYELPTIYTTNLTPTDLKAKVGERIASRIAHDATVIPIIGEDRRRQRAA